MKALTRLLPSILLFSTTPAAATTLIAAPEAVMAERSDLIVEGTVLKIRFGGNKKKGFKTFVRVMVNGGDLSAGTKITVTQPGGRTQEGVQVIFGTARFAKGEHVYLYLKKNEDGTFSPVDMAMGKLALEVNEEGTIQGTRSAGMADLMTYENGQLVHSDAVEPKSLDELRAARDDRAKAPVEVSLDELSNEEGTSVEEANNIEYQLMSPASRWFGTTEVWGTKRGDKALGVDLSNQIIRNTVDAWNQGAEDMDADLDLRYMGEIQDQGWGCGQGLRVSYDDPKNQVGDPVACYGALAVGGFCAGSQNGKYRRINSAAVVVNNGFEGCYFWNQSNLEEIMTHEIGHAIGLAHSNTGPTNDPLLVNATMYYAAHFDGRGASLMEYDLGALNFLYSGSYNGQPNPDPVPQPDPTPTPKPTPDPGVDGEYTLTLLTPAGGVPVGKTVKLEATATLDGQPIKGYRVFFDVDQETIKKGDVITREQMKKSKTNAEGLAKSKFKPKKKDAGLQTVVKAYLIPHNGHLEDAVAESSTKVFVAQ